MLAGRVIVAREDTIVKREGGPFNGQGGSESRAQQIPLFDDGSKRQQIKKYSAKSRNRLALKLRNTAGLNWLLLLTYREAPDGEVYKKHLAAFRLRLLRKYPDIYGVWVLEFQKRGVPHFHILATQQVDTRWLQSVWQEIIKDPKTRQCSCTKIRHPMKLATYLVKQVSKSIPAKYSSNTGRFWADFGLKNKPMKEEELNLPKQLFFDFVRFVRRAYKAIRRSRYLKTKIPGNGRTGFTGWNTGRAARQYLQHMGMPAAFENDTMIHLVYKSPVVHGVMAA